VAPSTVADPWLYLAAVTALPTRSSGPIVRHRQEDRALDLREGTVMPTFRFRAIVGLIALIAAVGVACGSEEPAPPASSASGEQPTVTTLKEGVLQVASCLDYKPFEWIPAGQTDPTGFDVDLSEEIASRLGLTVEWVTHDFDTVFTALSADQFDMVAAASTITAERDKEVDFSDPYYASRQSLIVNSTETPDIASTADLGEGDTVGVQKGTTGQMWAVENLVGQGVELKTFTNITPAFQDLEAGNIVGIVSDEPQAVSVAGTEFPSLAVVESIDTNENYGLALSESNPDLRDAVNDALAEIISDGTYETLFKKYFPDQDVPPQFLPSA
jgi:ABC-type amino acid transport substrate-binding protein